MPNINDYIKWRGDLELNVSEFNEIDSLILARFSYLPFESLMKKEEELTIEELSKRFEKADKNKLEILWPDDSDLLPLLGQSKRFGKMIATDFLNKFDPEQEKQFSAITVLLPDDTIFISYRGTDNTIIGWKEDFNMSFKSHIASQLDSVKYINDIAKKYQNNIRIGGHSKGGNLAVYAAVFAAEEAKKRIINVYNNDGPGFADDITNTKEYKEMIEKVHTYIPQSSVIGRLLNHEEKYTVVKSIQKGIMQHDLYSWQVQGTKVVSLKEVTNGSEFVDKTIKQWLDDVDPKQREIVIDTIFDILSTTEAESMIQIREVLKEVCISNFILISCVGGTPNSNNPEISSGTWTSIFERFNGNVMTCRWSVPTADTVSMMDKIYDNLLNKKMNFGEALIKAQREMKNSGKNELSWAGVECWIN